MRTRSSFASLAMLSIVACASMPERPATPDDPGPVPTIRVSPAFPDRAAANRIPGRVVTEFYVDGRGRVKDIEIVESEPEGLFDWSVLQSVRRWKYKPTIVDGEYVVHGPIRTHFHFDFYPCSRPPVSDEDEHILVCRRPL